MSVEKSISRKSFSIKRKKTIHEIQSTELGVTQETLIKQRSSLQYNSEANIKHGNKLPEIFSKEKLKNLSRSSLDKELMGKGDNSEEKFKIRICESIC